LSARTEHRRDRPRSAIAAALTVAVAVLLLVSFASIGRTSGYTLFRAGTGARAPAVAIDYAAVTDLGERIRIVLRTVRRGADAHPVPVVGGAARYEMVPTGKDNAKSLALAGSAALFAAFGLVVLWWGRDRASFWLGIACAALAPELLTLYGFLPEPLMLAARLAADLLTFLAFYALYAMAEAVARTALRADDPLRKALRLVSAAVIAVLTVAAAADVAGLVLPVMRGVQLAPALAAAGTIATKLSWSVVFCLLPVVLLSIAALRATTAEALKRSRLILLTTLAGLSGIAFSVAGELAAGVTPHFETLWFTLLLIPVGFIAVIRVAGVIDVQIIINRILVVTAMTLVVGLAITLVEMLVHGTVEEWIAPKDEGAKQEFNTALQFIVGFVIVVIFGNLHHRLDEAVERVVFRRRDRAIAALRDFAAHDAARIVDRRTLLERTAALVFDTMRTGGVAVYEFSGARFVLAASAGSAAWPPHAEDPRTLGDEDCSFEIAVADRTSGVLVVVPRTGSDDAFDEEEADALNGVARGVAEALVSLRVGEVSAFLGDLAGGRVDGAEARAQATRLREELVTADR